MFWQENINEEHFTVPEDIVDVLLAITSEKIPTNHAENLADGLIAVFPWLQTCAIHHIYLPKTGNGWQADLDAEFFYPSKRTKLILRVPQTQLSELKKINNLELKLNNYPLVINKFLKQKKLSDSTILFSQNIVAPQELSEDDFLQYCYQELQKLGIQPKKMLVGLPDSFKTNNSTLHTRSLMLADLSKQQSVLLQEKGIGQYQTFGCGIFVPQKGISEVGPI
jgi:CRISPR-associated protein Cas6